MWSSNATMMELMYLTLKYLSCNLIVNVKNPKTLPPHLIFGKYNQRASKAHKVLNLFQPLSTHHTTSNLLPNTSLSQFFYLHDDIRHAIGSHCFQVLALLRMPSNKNDLLSNCTTELTECCTIVSLTIYHFERNDTAPWLIFSKGDYTGTRGNTQLEEIRKEREWKCVVQEAWG